MAITRISRTRETTGFTLLEVLITVAIVGILAAIALPSYSDSVTRSKIIDGTAKLGDWRSKMEKYFMDNRTYLNGATCGVTPLPPSGADNFALVCGPPAPTATTYTLHAIGIPAMGMSASFDYQVDQANNKSSTGPAGWAASVGNCWAVRKDGSC